MHAALLESAPALSSNTSPIRNLGMEQNVLASHLASHGFGPSVAGGRHAYVLSPAAYAVSSAQQAQLARLATATYAAVECLNDRLCTLATGEKHLSHEEAYFLGLAKRATRSLLSPGDGVRDIPPLLKLDLIEDAEGKYRIAEVDAYNPRGLGYAALLESTLMHARRECLRFPGMTGIAALLRERSRYEVCHVLVSEFERYYATAFRVFAGAMNYRGQEMRLTHEEDVASGRQAMPRDGYVFAIPESMNKHPWVRDTLMDAYREGALRTFFPPVAYLGSKGFLPFLRSCAGMEEFIPPTALVGRQVRQGLSAVDQSRPLVLKAAMSSGLKSVFFSDLDSEFRERFAQADLMKHPGFVLQEQVPQRSFPVPVYDGRGAVSARKYYLRITAYVGKSGIFDLEVTGRPDRKVHGAPDCIMLPCILDQDSC